jgi:hypothetical protein
MDHFVLGSLEVAPRVGGRSQPALDWVARRYCHRYRSDMSERGREYWWARGVGGGWEVRPRRHACPVQ